MTKEYYKEVNLWKLKNFFLKVLKREGRQHIISLESEEVLAEMLANKLLEKINRETK